MTRSILPAELDRASVPIIRDTREQDGWHELRGHRIITGTLETGDYAPAGLENQVVVERKSVDDLVSCVTAERERFERELRRLLGIPTRAVVVEGSWADLEAGRWRSRVKPASVVNSVLGWMALGVPFVLAGSRAKAQEYAATFLFIAARRRYREIRGLLVPAKETRLSPNAQDPETINSFCLAGGEQ